MTRFLLLSLTSAVLALSGAGCTVLVDGTLAGRTGTDAATDDAGLPPDDTGVEMDAGPPVGACTGMPDGIRCMPEGIVEPFVCIDEVCVLSTCGDGARDDRSGSMHEAEECDDGNPIPGDGCEPDCTFSCDGPADCDDLELCSGVETCNATTHACEPGTAETDGVPCTIRGTAEVAACRGGVCRAGACPDGIVDAGEQCDPVATPVDGDGCEADCTFTCEADSECQDGDACNGIETCNLATHVCALSVEALNCDDGDPCTTDTCDPDAGCSNASVLVDADGDGHAAITTSCGGDDCDDTNAARYPGAPEMCGAAMDFNCDGSTGVTPVWYRDCDGDGFAASTTGSVTACTEPAVVSGCAGGWTSRSPTTISSTDCLDTNSSARPTQVSYSSSNASGLVPAYDWNCSDVQERQYVTNPRFYTECAYDSRGTCGGTWFYDVSAVPACGATTTLSYCDEYRPPFSLTDRCGRFESTTHRVACR